MTLFFIPNPFCNHKTSLAAKKPDAILCQKMEVGKIGKCLFIYISCTNTKVRPNKVDIIWEGHEILKSSPYVWLLKVHTVKSKVNISQNFVAFSEFMNFKYQNVQEQSGQKIFDKSRKFWKFFLEIVKQNGLWAGKIA